MAHHIDFIKKTLSEFAELKEEIFKEILFKFKDYYIYSITVCSNLYFAQNEILSVTLRSRLDPAEIIDVDLASLESYKIYKEHLESTTYLFMAKCNANGV